MSVFVDGHCHLDSPAVMFDALTELVGGDAKRFRGSVGAYPFSSAEDAPVVWVFEVHDSAERRVSAGIGDHLVLTYGVLVKLTDEEFQAV